MNLSETVKADYRIWRQFLKEQVEFSLPDSDTHTQAHCARVLLFCLIMAEKQKLSDQDKNTLITAACFHDSRRQDDWLDVGHGKRAADYYRADCEEKGRPFDACAYSIIAYHDREDTQGINALQEEFPYHPNVVLLYQTFKDADALDRFRLGPNALDVNYLRSQPAKKLVVFAKALLQEGPEKILET